MPTDFRVTIRRAMKRNGVSQGELSRRTRTSRQAINRYLAGKCGISDNLLAAVFDALGIGAVELLKHPKGKP